MQRHKWTQEEEMYLTNNYNRGNNLSACTERLGIPVDAVKKKAARLGVAAPRRNFTKEETAYISENYSHKGPKVLAREMGLSWTSICQLAQRRLGLRCDPIVKSENAKRTNKLWERTEETRKKIGDANRKYHKENRCVECGKKIARSSTMCRPCNLKSRGGEKHMWWNGGVTSIYQFVKTRLYPIWTYPILCRDNFRCQSCGNHERLEVHHVRKYKDIRDAVIREYPFLDKQRDKEKIAKLIIVDHKMEDGITLCFDCHKVAHFGKPGELLETPRTEDNQQPSRPNVLEFVGRKVQRLTGEDAQSNNPDTSARHLQTQEMMI
ncbi:MAG: hypothetical protein WC455_19810 [Dehalococcoidia bacterium]